VQLQAWVSQGLPGKKTSLQLWTERAQGRRNENHEDLGEGGGLKKCVNTGLHEPPPPKTRTIHLDCDRGLRGGEMETSQKARKERGGDPRAPGSPRHQHTTWIVQFIYIGQHIRKCVLYGPYSR